MDIKSEPKYETIHLTEINVSYPGGTHALTLEDGKDSYILTMRESGGVVDVADINVFFATGEKVFLEARNRNWYSIRPYTNRRLVKEAKQQEPTNG